MNLTVKLGLVTSMTFFLMAGCGHEHGSDDAHSHEAAGGHDEEPRTAQINLWSEGYELFIEHRLVVAGAPTRFVTHVTDLETFEPRTEGLIRLVCRLGQEAPIEHTEKVPSRAGIYEPTLTLPKPGDWDLSVIIPGADGESVVVLPRLKVYADAHEVEHAELPTAPEGISFLKEQQWKIGARTEPVTKRKLTEQLRLPATVGARPGNLAEVAPPVAGHLQITPGESLPTLGEKVKAGQVLAAIQPSFSELAARFTEAEGEVVRARLALEQAELALKRVEKLAQVEAKSSRELQEAEFAFKGAQAKHDAAVALQRTYRQATNPGGNGFGQPVIELRSPIAGTIIAQFTGAVGQYVTAEKPVFSILDDSLVFIEANLPETSVGRLGVTRAASYQLRGTPAEFTPIAPSSGGRLVFLGIRVDPATRTVPLVYEVTNRDGHLRVGQAVELYVETASTEAGLAIPSEAVVEEAGRPVAFVQIAGETFEKRDLTLGMRSGNWVQVVAGLAEGDRVVTKGAYAVRLASVSTSIPSHGHAH